MNRLLGNHMLKTLTFIFAFMISAVGVVLFSTAPVSAIFEGDIDNKYLVYRKDAKMMYFDGTAGTYKITEDIPQVKANPDGCINPDTEYIPIDVESKAFIDCTGLVITSSDDWFFDNANFSFAPGDFDHSESISIGGGKIVKKPSHTASGSTSQYAKAEAGDGSGCDSPNPDMGEACSLLVIFNNSYSGDFKIRFLGSPGCGTSSACDNGYYSNHEFWYQSPVTVKYRTLTFNPNGGTIPDSQKDAHAAVRIWNHMVGSNLLREYEKDALSSYYPRPERSGYDFKGWYYATSGGSRVTSRSMTSDDTLYAQWEPIITWSMGASTDISATTAPVGSTVTWTHTITNGGPDSTNSNVAYGHNHTNGWTGSTAYGTVNSGRAVGTAATYTESRAITAADIGKTLCSQAYASPTSNSSSATVYATSRCVTILGWSVGASTTVNMNDATVGDVVNWTHTVRNNGPGSTGSPISTGYNHTNGWSGSTGTGVWNPVQVNGATTSRIESYTIQQSDVGKTLCSQAYASPTSNSSSATVYATSQCVTVRNWELTALTYSAVNPANPMDNGQYNNTRKIAYPNYAAFGGHIAKPTDDKIYYAVNVQRGNDGGTRPSTFKYRPVWLFGTGMITANNVNSGQSDVSSLCAGLGFSYEPSFKRCSKNAPVFIDTSLPSGGASAFYTSTEPGRHWNNSMPMPTADLSKLKGMDICYILSLNRNRASQLNDENAAHFYWGSLDGTTENRCSVTVGTPWILEPRVSSIPADSSVGDTYTVTPRVGSSDATIQGTQHNISLVRVIGLSTWNPTMGLNVMGSPSPSSVNYGVGADGASATTISIDSNVTDPSFNNPSKVWSGTGVNEEFQEAWYGKKVCYYTVIATGGWAYDKIGEVRYSNPVCTKWAKGPQIQVRGADAYSGGSWTNSDSTVSTFNGGFEASSQSKSWRGSWSQYGLLSYKAPISEFGSSGYTMSTGSDTAKACSLIFANTINSSNCPSDGGSLYGNSSIDRKISLPKEAMFTDAEIDALPTVGSSYYGTRVIAGNTVSTLKLDNVPNGVYQVPHDTYIQDTKLRSSSQIVIVSKGTVHVDSGGVTTAASTFASLKDVPVFTLIARQILSQDSDAPRTQESIYGTYIATGSAAGQAFTSCYVANSTDVELRDGGFCGYQLRINGAVISRKTPILRRTIGGARTTINITANGETHQDAMTASEVFNYQPSLFLTPYALKDDGGTGSVWVTDRQTVLPARF